MKQAHSNKTSSHYYSLYGCIETENILYSSKKHSSADNSVPKRTNTMVAYHCHSKYLKTINTNKRKFKINLEIKFLFLNLFEIFFCLY